MAYRVGDEDFSLQLSRLQEAKVDAVVHWGDAVDGARILNQMRAAGMKQPFFACDRCASDEFVEDRRRERRRRRLRVSRGTPTARTRSSTRSARRSARSSTRSRKPTPPTPTTA